VRRINRAVIKQSIHRSNSSPLRSNETKTSFCVSDRHFENQGRECVIQLLAKYITFSDQNHHCWIDRLWYFDVEKYESDLVAFGIPIAMPVREPLNKPDQGASDFEIVKNGGVSE
jgi:hypothetical protein